MPTQHCDCGAKYKFPDSAVGKRAKCKKCGVVLTLADENEILGFAPDPDFDLPVEQVAAPIAVATPMPPTGANTGKALTQSETASGGFGQDLAWTLLFLSSPQNLVYFLVLWFAMVVGPMVPLVGGFVGIALSFWYAAYRFEVLLSAAGGEDDLPELGYDGDFIGEFILPSFKWMGCWLFVMLPAFVYMIVAAPPGGQALVDALGLIVGGIGAATGSVTSGGTSGAYLATVAVLFLGGLIAWPIILISAAMGGFGEVFRIDRLLRSVIRTLPAYLLTVLLVCTAMIAPALILPIVANSMASTGGTTPPSPSFGLMIAIQAAALGLTIYCDIVALRLIGVYYRHNKNRFAYNWG